jgi:hypothetical protein
MLPSWSLNQATLLSSGSSAMPLSLVLIGSMSYCSKLTPLEASSSTTLSTSSTVQKASVAPDLPALSGEG